MKIIIYSIVLLSLYSCHEDSKKLQWVKIKQLSVYEHLHPIIVSDSLQPIVDSLATYNVVEDELIGYTGSKSTIYQNFEKLIIISTDTELIKLTDHITPSVRSYAFWALAKKKNTEVKKLLLNHLNDTATFEYMSGCTILEERVNNFYLLVLTPEYIDEECLKLSKEEITVIKSKMEHQ